MCESVTRYVLLQCHSLRGGGDRAVRGRGKQIVLDGVVGGGVGQTDGSGLSGAQSTHRRARPGGTCNQTIAECLSQTPLMRRWNYTYIHLNKHLHTNTCTYTCTDLRLILSKNHFLPVHYFFISYKCIILCVDKVTCM